MTQLSTHCPECGSTNIDIIDGAVYHCDATQSGECQDCFCARKEAKAFYDTLPDPVPRSFPATEV